MQILQRQIDRLKENQSGVEDGAVMFYATDSCPENWAKITGFGGYYLRIQNAGETIGSIKEQMVHRHKHVSPIVHYPFPRKTRYCLLPTVPAQEQCAAVRLICHIIRFRTR